MILEYAAAEAPSANEYIVHHLGFLSNKEAEGIVDFSVIHWDSVFFAVLLAMVFGGAFYIAARQATRAGAQCRRNSRTSLSSSSNSSIRR